MTLTFTDTHTHTHTFHTSLWVNEAEWRRWAWDKWYNDIQAWLVTGFEREDEEEDEEEGEGQGSGSSEYRNYSSSSHTVAAHYVQTLAWQCGAGKKEGSQRGEGGFGGSRRADIMTTLCFRTAVSSLSTILSSLSQPRVLFSALSLRPWRLPPPLSLSSSLHLFFLSVTAALSSFQGESALIYSPSLLLSLLLSSLRFKRGDNKALWACHTND